MSAEVHVIYGPPGTGKTTKLISILEEEIAAGVAPNKIAYVSFTQEGAHQGKRRAKERFPDFMDKDFLYFRTLHSLAFGALGLRKEQVMSKQHYKEFSRAMGMNFLGYYTEELRGQDDRYLFYDQLAKNNPKAAVHYLDELDQERLGFVRTNYRRYKEIHNVVDFTDMLQMFVDREESLDIDVAFVDEAQDLTTLQWRVVWTAFAKAKRIYIAGDDDQAIYQWSGADVDQFLGIRADTHTVLSQSYRLHDEILNFSKRITDNISRRVEKEYHGKGKGGRVIRLLRYTDINIKPDETYMFLSRNRIFLEPIAEWVSRQGLLYDYLGSKAFSYEQYRLILLYERDRKNSARCLSPDALETLAPILKQGYTVNDAWYDAFNWKLEKIAYYRDVIRARPDMEAVNIRISTIHSVKGAEADNVILLPDITKRVFENLCLFPDSEHRAFYVACTRAKKNLFLVDPASQYDYPIMGM